MEYGTERAKPGNQPARPVCDKPTGSKEARLKAPATQAQRLARVRAYWHGSARSAAPASPGARSAAFLKSARAPSKSLSRMSMLPLRFGHDRQAGEQVCWAMLVGDGR